MDGSITGRFDFSEAVGRREADEEECAACSRAVRAEDGTDPKPDPDPDPCAVEGVIGTAVDEEETAAAAAAATAAVTDAENDAEEFLRELDDDEADKEEAAAEAADAAAGAVVLDRLPAVSR